MTTVTEKRKGRVEQVGPRIRNIAIALLVAFGLLAARLAYLQIMRGAAYARLADKNRLYLQRLRAPRGKICGRNSSVVLADNRAAWDIVIVPKECSEPEAVCQRLEQLIHIDGEKLLERLEDGMSEPYEQVDVKRDVPWDQLSRVEEMQSVLPGVLTVVRPQRRYVHGAVAGQILGYLAEANREEVERSEYRLQDLVGRMGLEQMHEDHLRGQDGELWVNVYASSRPQLLTDSTGTPYVGVDTYGRTLEEETQWRRDPQAGDSVYLTLDVELQAYAEQLLEGLEGAIVVLNAETGEVLTLASAPGFDPSIFVQEGQDEARRKALFGKRNPMLNRCYQEQHPPGSVFKVAVAIAALEEGVVTPSTSFTCTGHFTLEGGHQKRCWRYRLGGHGPTSLNLGLASSCDVYFYNLGLGLGIDRIHEWATRLGLGEKTGLVLDEVPGIMPSREWKAAQFREAAPWDRRWYAAETLDAAIGQGYVSVTPLQTAVMMATVVNDGRRVRPYIHADRAPEVSEPLFSESTLEAVRHALQLCVEKKTAPSGTGQKAAVPGIVVLGKTGTAQVVSLQHHEDYETEEDIPYDLRDHAWFVAGCPYEDPPIAISVLVEHGLHGSSAAAPLAGKVIEFFYSKEVEPLMFAKEDTP